MSAESGKVVLLVSHEAFLGGAERSLLELAESLRRNDEFAPCVACPSEGPLFEEAVARGIQCVPIPVARPEGKGFVLGAIQVLGFGGMALFLWRHARKRRAVTIHANGIKACLPALIAARLAGLPCVWHVRDYPRRYLPLQRMAMRLASRVIVPSEFLHEALRDAMGGEPNRSQVIYNGVQCPDLGNGAGPQIRRELRAGTDALLVTMIAQLVPWKRHDLFVEAASLLAESGENLCFMIVGSDPWKVHAGYEQRLHKLVTDAGLGDHVTFAGQRNDVGAILAASDVVVLPSDNEPFGRVVVEAWWAGKPVVVSDGGGPAELVEDGRTGLVFPHGDASALACAIRRLAANPDIRGKLGEAGRREAPGYDVGVHAEAVTELYRELVA